MIGYWQERVRMAGLYLCNSNTGRILEIGCGLGLFLDKILRSRPRLNIFGIDSSIEIISEAKRRLGDKASLIQADAMRSPFLDNIFDSVVCINLLYNLSKEESYIALKEAIRVCKINGEIVFEIRNSLNLLVKLKYKLTRYYDPTAVVHPLITHNSQEVINFLETHGCKVIDRVNIGFPRNRFAPIIVLKIKKYR
ncbi:MAG: class I SAM-dependent methyltransferase [Candidatus Omnitrophica bacterium]|nr:class I SAM-dependent methyltransferase [Candidatus Omnitrophota bacterium]